MTAPVSGTLVACRLRIQYPSTIVFPDGAPPPWVATTLYSAGAVVTVGTAWFQCILQNSNHTPPNGTYWTQITPSSLAATQFIFSTLSSVGYPYLAEWPNGDGSEIDTLSGQPTIGTYRFLVIDATPTGAVPPGVITATGVVTSAMGDTTGQNQLLSRRAYGELSRDGGTTWSTLVAGYVSRLQLVDAATYEFTIGETRRVEQSAQLFQTIAPGLDQGTCILGGPIGDNVKVVNPSKVVNASPIWNQFFTYTAGQVALWSGVAYLAIAGSTGQQPPNTTYWAPIVGPLTVAPGIVWNSGTSFSQGTVTTGGDGLLYIASTTNTNVQPVNDVTGTWRLIGSASGSPQNKTIQATPWNAATSYVPGNVVYSNGVTYICIAGNTNDQPPDAVHWTAVPPGAQVVGIWSPTVAYSPPAVVAGLDGNAYICVVANTGVNPVTDLSFAHWDPVSDIPFGNWGSIQDYGGAKCQVIAVGKNTPSLRVTIIQGWFKQPSPKAGQAPWVLCGYDPLGGVRVALPSWAINAINGPIPSLAAAYGPSPVGYGATYLQQLLATLPHHLPTNILTAPGGVTDTFTGDSTTTALGWVIGGLAMQVTLPNGQEVTVNAYPQTIITDDGRVSSTTTPGLVIQHPLENPANIAGADMYLDWHDFYTLTTNGAGSLVPSVPLDKTGQPVSQPAVGATLSIKAVVVPVSSDYPLHWSGHPVDLLTTIWTNLGIAYDVMNLQSVRSALGDSLVLLVRITSSMSAQDVFNNWIAGPCGVSLRVSPTAVATQFGTTQAAYQLLLTRTLPSALPTVVWTDADCYDEGGGGSVFDLDDQYICQQVMWSYSSFLQWNPAMSQSRTGDDAVEVDNTVQYVSTDFATYGVQTASYQVPGSFGMTNMQQPQTMSQWASARSNEIFELFQRSATLIVADILATSPQANLGDFVVFNSIRFPDASTNMRGTPRLCRVVKKTLSELGAAYTLQDVGFAAQPAPVAPAFTLALDAADPDHVVDVTVTNIGTLVAEYPNGHVTVAYQAGPAAPGTSQNGIKAIDMPIANIPATGLIVLPAQPIGTQLWVRMNARPGGGQLPSIWTAWADITTDAPTPIAGLAATVSPGGQCLLSWTNADTSTPITIWLMSSGPTASGSYSVLLSNASFTLVAGQTLQLSAQTYNSVGVLQTGSTYTWGTSASGIATVSVSGLVTAVANGTVTISATDTAHGSAVGDSFGTVTGVLAIGSIVVSPNTFQLETGGLTLTATATAYDTSGRVMSPQPTFTWSSLNTGIATVNSSTGVVTSVAPGTATIKATSGSVSGTATCTVTNVFSNLAQATRAAGSGKTFFLTVNQAYPNDNFAMVGGVQNTSLGLPPIKQNYGTFTPGVVDGLNWSELVDINGVVAFSATATASMSNNGALASITGTFSWKLRARVDEIKALGASSGAGLWCMGSSATANKKLEAYLQTGATNAGGTAVQLAFATYETGSVRTQVAVSGFADLSKVPNGCWLEMSGSVDTATAHTVTCWVTDENGTQYGTSTPASVSVALNTDGGVNGAVFLNECFNTAAGPTQAMRYGGLGMYNVVAGTGTWRYQPTLVSDAGLVQFNQMGDGIGGSVAALQHTFTGNNFTCSAGVTGQYDNGGPYNWLLYNGSPFTSGPGGEVMDETMWNEHTSSHGTVVSVSGPTNMTFASPYDPTVVKARSLGIRSRAYLLEGSGSNSIYGSVVTNQTTAQQALTTITRGIVLRNVTTYGTAQQGGIRTWNINEFINGGSVVASLWQTAYPISLTGTKTSGWAGYLANAILTVDPSAMVMFNFNNIHLAANSAQQAAALTFLTQFHADYPSINMGQIVCGCEFHQNNATATTATDASTFHSFIASVVALGCLWLPSECDMTDIALPGTGASSRTQREALSVNQWKTYATPACWGEASVWPNMYGLGHWQKASIASWINISPPAGAIRSDGDFEEACLVDENYNRMGGAGSAEDVYGVFYNFAAGQAA